MAPATDRRKLLIVAHGSPSAPARAEAALQDLADGVAAHLPGWQVCSATLAAAGAMRAAVDSLGPNHGNGDLAVIPHFMADGWFVCKELPRRLAACGATSAALLLPFGLLPGLPELCLARAVTAARRAGTAPGQATLLLAAHGSPSDPRPGAAARRVAEAISASGRFREVRLGFIDQAPGIAAAARIGGPAICLPLFAAAGSHVDKDIPAALAAAGFAGALLPPIGIDRNAPRLIARAARDFAVDHAA